MKLPAARCPLPALESTWFDARWGDYAREHGLALDDPLRRDALEFFSWGVVHEAVVRQRWEELFAEDRKLQIANCKLQNGQGP